MNNDKTGNVGSTAAQSPKPPARSELGEAEFLQKQAEDATAAMTAVVHGIADSLKDAANPAAWTRHHPWPSLGAAAVLGFVAASAITPSKDQTWKERFESLFPDVPAPDAQAAAATTGNYSGGYAQQAPPTKKPSKMWSVAAPVLDMLKTALMTSISSALATKAAQDAPPSDNANAHATDPTAPV
jgi:hypothetical protein